MRRERIESLRVINLDIERLRLQLCTLDLATFLLRKKQLLKEYEEMKVMLEKQEEFMRIWE